MAVDSKISWTQDTHNFWTGCKKVSDGCKFCYMYRDKERFKLDPTVVIRAKQNTFTSPLKTHEPRLIFTCSWSDFFIEEADDWRADAWQVIRDTPWHTWQILTKRPERVLQCLPDDWGNGYPNVWLGTTIENQASMHRLKTLSAIPAKCRFISFEPLIGAIEFSGRQQETLAVTIDWIILGGESGNDNGKYRYRPAEFEWFKTIIDSTPRHIAIFVKQTGTHLSKLCNYSSRHGTDINEWPGWMRVQQMPTRHMLYPLVARLKACAKAKYPDRPWTHTFMMAVANEWSYRVFDLLKRVEEFEAEIEAMAKQSKI